MEVLAVQHPPHTSQGLPHDARAPPPPLSAPHHRSAPPSQETIASVHSSDISDLYSLQTSLSNGSQRTAETDLSSLSGGTKLSTMQRRARTPEEVTSPISVASPTFNGTKRTASGHVKNAASLSSTPYTPIVTPGRARAESMSSNSSRVGELAASLKMRLGYAMTKVQHGWEHKTISELERLTAGKPAKRHSMSQDARPMTAYNTTNYQGLDSALSPPAKRRSGMFGTTAINGPQLEPAAPIHSHTHSRSVDLRRPNGDTFAMSPPQTPSTHFPRRPQTIRTDTQTAEAERDALQALTQLGSPHNSQYSRHQNTSQGNSSQTSPLRAEFASRRVSFARGDSDGSAVTTSDEGQCSSRVRP